MKHFMWMTMIATLKMTVTMAIPHVINNTYMSTRLHHNQRNPNQKKDNDSDARQQL